MRTENPNRVILGSIAAVAKALGVAVLSLAVGVTVCLCMLLGGTALAGS